MKSIIKGRMYNTETASHIFLGGNRHIDVFRKRTGEIFALTCDNRIVAASNYSTIGYPDEPATFEAYVRSALEGISSDFSDPYQEDAVEAYITLFGEPEE